MKKVKSSIFLLFAVLFMVSCSSNSSTVLQQTSSAETRTYIDLVGYLRANTNLQIRGAGNNVKINVRGVNTFNLGTQPLYVLNGVVIGHNYNKANEAVAPNTIKKVRVLKSLSETVRYGEEGVNGVILIKTN